MIEKENERLSPLSLTRIPVGELRAIAQKLCISIQRGGACRNKCRHARRVEVDQFGYCSGVEVRVPDIQINVLRDKTETRQNLSSEHFDTAGK